MRDSQFPTVARNYQQILERAKNRLQLSRDDLVAVRSQLASGEFEEDPYTLLHILGKAGDTESLPIIWKYLEFDSGNADDDEMIRRIALQVVGQMWAVPQAFDVAIDKAFNDPSDYVRAMAATVIGTLGSRYPQFKRAAAACLLRGTTQKEALDWYVWESFYYALLQLLGVPASKWPQHASGRLRESDVRDDVIAEARTIVARSE